MIDLLVTATHETEWLGRFQPPASGRVGPTQGATVNWGKETLNRAKIGGDFVHAERHLNTHGHAQLGPGRRS